MKIKNYKNSGLAMAEALLTVTMLMIASLILSTVFQSSLSITALSKNYLVAQNLAVEGVEIVKQIRNTNWMINPNKKSCWLSVDPADGCINSAIAETNYVVFENSAGAYKLVAQDDGQLYVDEILNRYTPVKQDNNENKKANFKRLIKFKEIAAENATVEVTVSWQEGVKENKITVTEVITNSL